MLSLLQMVKNGSSFGLTIRFVTFSLDLVLIKLVKILQEPGRLAQSVGHLTRKSEVLSSIPGLAIYFRFSFRLFKRGSCQLLAKVYARSTG